MEMSEPDRERLLKPNGNDLVSCSACRDCRSQRAGSDGMWPGMTPSPSCCSLNEPHRRSCPNHLCLIPRILFPGGGSNLVTSLYARSAKIFYDLAIKVKKESFSVQCTCWIRVKCVFVFRPMTEETIFPCGAPVWALRSWLIWLWGSWFSPGTTWKTWRYRWTSPMVWIPRLEENPDICRWLINTLIFALF